MRNGEGCFGRRTPRLNCRRAPRELKWGPMVVLRDETRGPDLQTQIADESNTQAVLQLSSEASTHQPHRCSTRDQRHITENSPIKPEALGLVKRFWRILVRRVLDGKGAGLVYPPLARGVTPSDGSTFQPKITCSEGHTIRNLDWAASSALQQRMSAGRHCRIRPWLSDRFNLSFVYYFCILLGCPSARIGAWVKMPKNKRA